MSEGIHRHRCTPACENKPSTTVTAHGVAVTTEPRGSATGLCCYVMAGGTAPFCNRPALPGRSYCAGHHALCAVEPASPAFAALAEIQLRAGDKSAPPPPELAWLRAPMPPEAFDESDAERLAGLDLPPAEIAPDE